MKSKSSLVYLSEGIGEELDFYLGIDALVQYVIYGIEDGHVDVHVAVDRRACGG